MHPFERKPFSRDITNRLQKNTMTFKLCPLMDSNLLILKLVQYMNTQNISRDLFLVRADNVKILVQEISR